MKYTISYKAPNTQYIPIKASFDVSNAKEITLQFPSWRPGRYERSDFVKNIHGFHVLNDQGGKTPSSKIAKDQWSVNTENTQEITVHYKYHAAELNAGSTYMDDQQLYVNPVNCLVFIPSQQLNPCELTLDIPENFEIAAGIPFANHHAHFEDYHQLVDNPFIASPTLHHFTFNCKSVKFHLWFQGDVKLDEKKIIDDFSRYTEHQIEQFGEFPVNEYHYLFQILPEKAYHGVEHQNSTVIALGPTYDLMSSLYNDFLGVSSHELYHCWNVKALRPVEMYPYDYATENYSRLGYVTEGVTTYMGDLFLLQSGVKDWKWYKSELEVLLQRHFDNFGRFNYSVAESSFDTWLDGYVAGAPNRKVSIYNEGALLAFVLDCKIRTNSENNASLHTVMKAMYDQFALKKVGYTENDFKGVLEQYANENLEDFFDNYYNGLHSFEPVLVNALEQIGLELKMKPNPLHSIALLGIKTSISDGRTIIKNIYPGSSADLGGVTLEDEVVGINGFKVTGDLNKWVEYFKDDSITLLINRKGRLIEISCPNVNKSYYPIYAIEKLKIPSNLQKRIFKKWSAHTWDEI
ncbi:MAG: hypothetical protein WDZ35_02095 [Crocinitomicaceae bacterium]